MNKKFLIGTAVITILITGCREEPEREIDRPSFYLEKLLYAFNQADESAKEENVPLDKGYAGFAAQQWSLQKLSSNYSDAADILKRFDESSNATIRQSAEGVSTSFMGLKDVADASLSEVNHFEKGEGNSQAFPDFRAETKEKREKLWAALETNGVQPILELVVKNKDSVPPIVSIPYARKVELEKLVHYFLMERGSSYYMGRPMISVAEIYKALSGKDPDPMPHLEGDKPNETALFSDANSDKALSQSALGPVIEAALQAGFKQGAQRQMTEANHSFDVAFARISELTDQAQKQKFLASLAMYQNNAGLYDDAKRTVQQFTDPAAQVDQLYFIAEYEAPHNPEEARRTYQEAINDARQISDSNTRDKKLAMIAFYQNMSHFRDDAERTTQEITSREIQDDTWNRIGKKK